MFAWLERAELSVVVDEDQLTPQDGDDHVGCAVAIYITKTEGYHCQVLSRPDQGRTQIKPGFGGIPAGKFDDLHLPVQVEGDEVAGTGHGIVVSHHGVTLERARTPVVQVILADLPPTQEQHCQLPDEEHGTHAESDI